MAAIAKPYETAANILTVLGLDTSDVALQAQANFLAGLASDAIDQFCNRTFTTTSAGSTKQFYASASDTLWITDAAAVTGITVDGVALAGGQWETLPFNDAAPPITHLRRLTGTGGSPTPWAARGVRSLVVVTGTWGYSTTLPSQVQESCRIMACRLWQRQAGHYDNERGNNAQGMGIVQSPKCSLDEDCKQMLGPFVRNWHYANTGVNF